MRHAARHVLCVAAFACAPDAASAAPVALRFDSVTETKTLGAPLNTSSPISIDGALNGTGAFSNALTFVAGSSTLAFTAGWLTAPPTNRTIGVNIDLFDAFSNALVASDTFQGLTGSLATSTLLASVVPGAAYRLVTSGTAVGFGTYRIDLVNGNVPPAAPAVAPGMPDLTHYVFDTHAGTKTATASLAAGDEIVIDGIPARDGGTSLSSSFGFRVGAGGLSAGVVWIVDGVADPLRTIGVNVDLFDFNDTLVASDTFVGLIDGQAFSQFALPAVAPGDYRLVFTGTSPNGGGRFRIDLAARATAPGFAPIDVAPAAVPEPATAALVLIGTTGLLLHRRRRLQVAHVP